MDDTVSKEVFGYIQDISAPGGIRSITPKLVARELNEDPGRVFEALVALSDVGLLTQNVLVMCPNCSHILSHTEPMNLNNNMRCEYCCSEFSVSGDNLMVSFTYVPQKKTHHTTFTRLLKLVRVNQ
jgi:hypothetical protein